MNPKQFLPIVQSRAARIAVGASTVRGRGNVGVVAAARAFLCRVDLAPFGCSDPTEFRRALDRQTKALCSALPKSAQHWGISRKVLNIFLRDCLYTTYLCETYYLGRAERLFELPLDSITATELKKAGPPGQLPAWPGVRHVTPELNDQLQEAADREAKNHGLARVHLDALWWSKNQDEA
jgi:hypothetical protein